jgi:hypothetical protein
MTNYAEFGDFGVPFSGCQGKYNSSINRKGSQMRIYMQLTWWTVAVLYAGIVVIALAMPGSW